MGAVTNKPDILTPQEQSDLLQQAKAIHDKVCLIHAAQSESWWMLGEYCTLMQQRRLYEFLGYRRFDDWLESALSISRMAAYEAMRVWKALGELPRRDKLAMKKQNAKLLAKMPESKRRSREWIHKAQMMSEREFAAEVEADRVGAEKSEPKVHKLAKFEKSQWDTISRWLEHMRLIHEVERLEEAIELIAADHMAGCTESPMANSAENQNEYQVAG